MESNIEQSLTRAQSWLKENTRRHAFKKLNTEIIERGICTECGACVASCPVTAITGDRSTNRFVPKLTGECVSCGMCYTVCPRTVVLSLDLIGDFRSVWKVRSKLDGKKQDGGAVTAVLHYLLDKKIIDAAVVAASIESPWLPDAKVVTDPSELPKYGGTIYTHAPVVQAMIGCMAKGHMSVAVVGTSCNIDAIAKMEAHPAGLLKIDPRLSAFKIGLFCTESFDYNGLRKFIESSGIEMKQIKKMVISKGVFRVETASGNREWPIADLANCAAQSCWYCRDFTSRNADLSCGNVGSEEGWTTVIVRSARGEHVIQEAVASETIEAQLVDAKDLRTIENISRSKAMRYYGLHAEHQTDNR